MSLEKLVFLFGAMVAGATPLRASAQQVSADCEGWLETTQWPSHGVYVTAEATLEELQNGVFVPIDVSQATAFAGSGGEVLLGSQFAFTLQSGTYRIRALTSTYDGASSV